MKKITAVMVTITPIATVAAVILLKRGGVRKDARPNFFTYHANHS